MVRITDTDRGYRRLLTNVRKMGRTTVSVGVSDAPHVGTPGMSIADIGAIHEFGPKGRSFLRAWVDEEQRGLLAWLQAHVWRALVGSGQWAQDFGEYCVEGVRARIRRGVPPTLEDATVKRKTRLGYTDPETALVATHQLIDGIEFEVRR